MGGSGEKPIRRRKPLIKSCMLYRLHQFYFSSATAGAHNFPERARMPAHIPGQLPSVSEKSLSVHHHHHPFVTRKTTIGEKKLPLNEEICKKKKKNPGAISTSFTNRSLDVSNQNPSFGNVSLPGSGSGGRSPARLVCWESEIALCRSGLGG